MTARINPLSPLERWLGREVIHAHDSSTPRNKVHGCAQANWALQFLFTFNFQLSTQDSVLKTKVTVFLSSSSIYLPHGCN